MPEPRHLIVLAVAIAGALSLYGGLISRTLVTPARRRRLTATGIAQLVLAFSFFLPVGVPTVIFQALLALAIVLIALKIPRGFFAEPTDSK